MSGQYGPGSRQAGQVSRDRVEVEQGLKRELNARQMAMVAVGGSIGTGLLLGSGAAIQVAGPAVVVTSAPAGSGMIANILVEGRKTAATASSTASASRGASRWRDDLRNDESPEIVGAS